mgnify:FL=1
MSYSKSRDMRIADETLDDAKDRQALMCAATGCPNRWSIDQGNGRLCSWHDRTPANHWPQVTQEQIDADADRVMRQYIASTTPVPRIDKLAVLAKLAEMAQRMRASMPSRQWAYDMRERERAGVRLDQAQREMMHGALHGQPEGEP